MKTRTVITHVQFSLFVISPFIIAVSLLIGFYGCQKKVVETKAPATSVTLENLQVAYAKEAKMQRMYTLFAQRAEKEHVKNMASLYKAIARSEEIHAASHVALLRQHGIEPKPVAYDSLSIGTTQQTLKMALSSEDIEAQSMYPNLIRTADIEKDTVALNLFQRTMDADVRQLELLKEASDKQTKIVQVTYFVCPDCGFIMTSAKTDECPTCHTKKEKFEKI